MEIRSQLVQLQVTDASNKISKYYTYDGYYNQKDRYIIRQFRKDVEKRTLTSAFVLGLLTYYTSRKTQMPTINIKSWVFPLKGIMSGIFGFVGGYLLFDFIAAYQMAEFYKTLALNSTHLPLWKNKNLAVNPERVYFQLDDSKDNEISIFHLGLTPAAAARMLPDKIIGSVPQKPIDPQHRNH